MGFKKLSRLRMAQLVTLDIPEGSYVNLGIGMPTLVGDCLPMNANEEREIILHSENGILGMGPADLSRPFNARHSFDPDLVNASRKPVGLQPGASITDHVVSFAMMRGGHLDYTVLGAFQVAANGDLANWDTGARTNIPSVGGAMDLVAGTKNVFVMMEHNAKDGEPKLVERCTYPLTGAGVVDRIYTDLAIIDVDMSGLTVRGMVEGLTREELQGMTAAPLKFAADVAVLKH
jgi:3-oxoadipate CoA-transferase beta subunit